MMTLSRHLALVRDVGPEDFSDALIDGLKNNSSEAEFAAMKPRIDQFRQAIVAAGEVKSGSVVHLDYLPETGTRLAIGGKQLGKDIPGEDFYNALLRIWIGDKPIQDNLKEALLGKPFGSPSCGDELHAQFMQGSGKFNDAGLVGDGEECVHGGGRSLNEIVL